MVMRTIISVVMTGVLGIYGLITAVIINDNMTMAMIPCGSDGEIQWPPGTKFINCWKTRSGNWIMIISAWEKNSAAQLGQAGQSGKPDRSQHYYGVHSILFSRTAARPSIAK